MLGDDWFGRGVGWIVCVVGVFAAFDIVVCQRVLWVAGKRFL